ncbi:hypothetical protein HRI_000595000 [Hibiscus trionum]|uniref:Uncharacterized protein n=1 Tax=Hibiscus trionum TaxID=183268 RepID=A0A9W7LLS7_HIBTR|nr:hypothetical protein HRI_000595000 [Hibiscus trionum]
MASMVQFCFIIGPSNLRLKYSSFRFCFQNPIYRKNALSSVSTRFHAKPPLLSSSIVCSAANKPSSSSKISSDARIRSEVLSPFRSLRMFFYLAFIASGASGVLVVPLATDGNSPSLEFDESEDIKEITAKRKRLWQLTPVYVSEWTEWLNEQKKLAGVSPESPVYLSLRLDGRVPGSGVGYPPWNAFVAQLPPVKGLWSGLLDGMDGRVL